MKNRLILVGLASFLLWMASLLMNINTEGLLFVVKYALTIAVLLLISFSWVCFTLWFMMELHGLTHLFRKFFKKRVDSRNDKR